jgi:Protein of unknown function (DUF3048) N-terminal domain/Protein of unknown function (DUF3048) C-terminal domain
VIRTRTAIAAAIVAAELLVLAACSGGGDDDAAPATTAAPVTSTTEAPTSTSSTTTTTTTTEAAPASTAPVSTAPTTTTEPEVLRMPLTGVPVADPSEIPQRPAQAVKIDNVGPARPQTGLNSADIVFEEIINDGATRFATVFHSQGVDTVGPVRSGRHPDIEILESLDHPLFVWSGGNAGVTYYIEHSQLVDLSANHTSGYYRRSGRRRPWNLYTSSEAMWSHSPPDFRVPPQVFKYLNPDEPITNGQPATTINVTMDNVQVRWEYNSDTGLYYRFQDGGPHNTEDNGQVTTNNLVLMMCNYLPSPIDARTPDAQTLGSNPVYVFTGGTVRVGSWLRFASTDPYQFFDNFTDLNPIELQPGRSWVELPRNIEGSISWS